MEKRRDRLMVGFTARNMAELERVSSLGVDVTELSLGGFSRSGLPAFIEKGKRTELNFKFCKTLSDFARRQKIAINLHDHLANAGGCCMMTQSTVDRVILLETIHNDWDIGKVFTTHPPVSATKMIQLANGAIGLFIANLFWRRIDRMRQELDAEVKIGIENQPARQNEDVAYLRSDPEGLGEMRAGTKTIDLTVDVGHIDPPSEFNDYLAIGNRIVNLHLHGGQDEHLPPTPENVTAYSSIIEYLKQADPPPPVILEVLKEYYSDNELKFFVEKLEGEVDSP